MGGASRIRVGALVECMLMLLEWQNSRQKGLTVTRGYAWAWVSLWERLADRFPPAPSYLIGEGVAMAQQCVKGFDVA